MRITKVLSKKEVLLFFTVASFVYVYPIVHADYAYVDDSWREILAIDDWWRIHGRVLAEVVTKLMAFNNATINIFPLPLLIATFAFACAMTRLTLWYFPRPEWTACLVVLPLLCNPFFLGNISFQYDGPGMMLAVVAAVSSITCHVRNSCLRGCVSAILIAVLLSIYQLVITVFIGLCCMECLWNVRNGKPAQEVLREIGLRGLQLFLGGGVYYFTAFKLTSDRRGSLAEFDSHWLGEVVRKFKFSMEKVFELINAGNGFFSILMVIVAGVGYVLVIKNVLALAGGRGEKILVLGACLCVPPVLIVCVPGPMLFVLDPNLEARNYLGFSVVLFFLLLMSREVLGRAGYRLRMLLVIPVLAMYSFSYGYGQVLIAKKELETAMAMFIAYDIIATKEFLNSPVLYYIEPPINGKWLPKAQGAINYMPALRYLLSSSSMVLRPNTLPQYGINNVVSEGRAAFDAATAEGKTYRRVVDRKFYSFYVTESGDFIVMKDLTGSEGYIRGWWR
jgi:hypothetical protein